MTSLRLYISIILILGATLARSQIINAEYFWDVMPATGAGTPLSVVSGSQIDLLENIPSNDLVPGIHTLGVRVQDQNGNWSLPVFYPVNVRTEDILSLNTLVQAEYFFDSDPGIGNGTAIALSSTEQIDIPANIPTAGLDFGIHSLSIRVLNGTGQWGIPETAMVFVTNKEPGVLADLVQAEYFFDSDPGIGSGSVIDLDPGSIIDLSSLIATADLEFGIHSFSIRFLNTQGEWGLPQTAMVFVNNKEPNILSDLQQAEYFFDTDPGPGNAVPIAFDPSSTVDITQTIDISALELGIHNLTVRFMNSLGEWSIIASKPVFITQEFTGVLANLTEAEYFFDTDPGVGNGIPMTIEENGLLYLEELVDADQLGEGSHLISIRFRNEHGEWGLSRSVPFRIIPDNRISKLEWFFDSDPGSGLADRVLIDPPVDLIDSLISLGPVNEVLGLKDLSFRVGTDQNIWSLPFLLSIEICDGPIPSIQSSTVCEGNPTVFTDQSGNVIAGDIYSWDFDADGIVDSNVEGDESFQYSLPGNYYPSLQIDRAGCVGITTVSAKVDTLATISISPVQSGEYGTPISLQASLDGPYEAVTWSSSGDGSFNFVDSLNTTFSPTLKDALAGSITVTLAAESGNTCNILPVELNIPLTVPPDLQVTVYNALSPNEDGMHDFLEIENIEAYPGNTVTLFNRWGKVLTTIKEYDNETNHFNGSINGQLVPPGTYFYEIDLGKDEDPLKGFIMISY